MEQIGYFDALSSHIKAGFNNLDDMTINLQFGERKLVEEVSGGVQPVCAGCVITKTGKILALRKTVKSTGKNSPEANTVLLYVGGHMDKADFENGDLMTSFKNGMQREIYEELGFVANTDIAPFITYLPISEKSKKHMGVIFPVILEHEFDPEFLDGKAKFINVSELKSIENLESWSSLLVDEIVKLAAAHKHQDEA